MKIYDCKLTIGGTGGRSFMDKVKSGSSVLDFTRVLDRDWLECGNANYAKKIGNVYTFSICGEPLGLIIYLANRYANVSFKLDMICNGIKYTFNSKNSRHKN